MSQLSVEVRESRGKGVARKLRAQGRIPAVMYGQGKQPLALALEPRALEKLLASEGHNALFDLAGPGVGKRTVLVKELQRDPVRLLIGDEEGVDLGQSGQGTIRSTGLPIRARSRRDSCAAPASSRAYSSAT